MLCVAAVSAVVLQAAVLLLPLPTSVTALQPAIDVAPSLKLTLPVGLLPTTVAVNVTLVPNVDGLSELPTVVVDDSGPAAMPHASTSVMREQPARPAVTLMRMRSVV